MPAARYWRIANIETYAGGDLELSEVALYEGATRVDGSATVSSVVAPVSGALSDLGDASFSTSARWAGDAVRLPGFAVVWDFGAGVTKDVTSVGIAGPSQESFAHRFAIEYSSDGAAWTTLYSPPVASKWPGAEDFYTIDAAGTEDDWPALLIGHSPDANGFVVSAWTRDGDTFTYTTGVPANEGAGAYGIARHGAGEFYVTGQNVFVRRGRAFSKGPTFDVAPLIVVRWAAYSPDGTYLVTVNSNNSPYINIFKRGADGNFVKLSNPATLPVGDAYGCSFDPSGTYLAVAHVGSQYITIYKRSGDTFTKLPNPTSLPSGHCLSCVWDPTGTYLAVGTSASPYLVVYERSGDTFTKLSNPATTPNGSGLSCVWDPTGTYLAHGYNGALGLRLYKLVAGSLTHLGVYSVGAGSINGMAFDATGTYLAVAKDSAGGAVVFKRTGDSLSQIATLVIPGLGISNSVAFLPFSALSQNMDPANFDATPLRTPRSDTLLLGSDVPDASVTTLVAPASLDIYDAGRGRITGTVKEKNTPANTPLKRRVVLLSMPGSRAIRETWSDEATGAYQFAEIAMDRTYTVISYDHTGIYRGVVADNLTPELML